MQGPSFFAHYRAASLVVSAAFALLLAHCGKGCGCGADPEPAPAANTRAPAAPETALGSDEMYIPEAAPEAPEAPVEPEAASEKRATRKPVERKVGCDGVIEAKDARAVIAKEKQRVRTCYEKRLRVDNTLQGLLQVTLTIAANGKVSKVGMGGSLRDRQVQSCVRELAKGWRFTKPKDGNCAVVVAPFSLTPSGS